MVNDADKLIPTRQSPPYSIRIILLDLHENEELVNKSTHRLDRFFIFLPGLLINNNGIREMSGAKSRSLKNELKRI